MLDTPDASEDLVNHSTLIENPYESIIIEQTFANPN